MDLSLPFTYFLYLLFFFSNCLTENRVAKVPVTAGCSASQPTQYGPRLAFWARSIYTWSRRDIAPLIAPTRQI
ncbi:hypothetical protein F5144DRAFT_585534 [Chaetomium tenue]|uniref:Uncharacterized protein n=1 Tax=Chaetomium tenue TaxID=1854479 RepID=A0ACB7NUP9_9PEZI|nr:hypothetical protein F5144DRAFT_585534 [Chaetomium globosum]